MSGIGLPASNRWAMKPRALLAAAALSILWACGMAAPDLPPATPGPGALLDAGLAQPRVAPREPGRARYVRDEWQKGWADDDGDSCNTREEVLLAESATPAQTGPGCKVLAGQWNDRYTGRRLTGPPRSRSTTSSP